LLKVGIFNYAAQGEESNIQLKLNYKLWAGVEKVIIKYLGGRSREMRV
jgi:hypothetical protein